MEYITLDKGIPVWIPVYEASLQFRIAKLGDTLDSLLFMILYMKNDHKSIEDIVAVMKLSPALICHEITELEKNGIWDSLNDRPTETGIRILSHYKLVDDLSEEKVPLYIDSMSGRIHLLKEKDEMKEEIPSRERVACIYLENSWGRKVRSLKEGITDFYFENTEAVVQEILNQKNLDMKAEDFHVLTRIGKRKYIKKYIKKIPVFQNSTEACRKSETVEVPVQCAFSYCLYVIREKEESLVFYMHPVTGEIKCEKFIPQNMDGYRGILKFEPRFLHSNEEECVYEAISEKGLLPEVYDTIEKYEVIMRGIADGFVMLGGGWDEV